jgi:hypothetical protein
LKNETFCGAGVVFGLTSFGAVGLMTGTGTTGFVPEALLGFFDPFFSFLP